MKRNLSAFLITNFALLGAFALGAYFFHTSPESRHSMKAAKFTETAEKMHHSSADLLLATANDRSRDESIVSAAMSGFVPSFLTHYRAIETGDNLHKITFFAAPDYFAIGNNQEFTRVPLSLEGAITVARKFHALPPTRKMVDIIYQNAVKKLQPRFYAPSPQMTSSGTIIRHNTEIQSSLRPSDLGSLIAGHKKDIVISPRLLKQRDRVAIYGWHTLSAKSPIQPLSLWHGSYYVDYSHGLRLIHKSVIVDGKIRSLRKVLADPDLAHYLSDEGPFDVDAIIQQNADPTYKTAQK